MEPHGASPQALLPCTCVCPIPALHSWLQNVPAVRDHHKLAWKLWHYPVGPADGDVEVCTLWYWAAAGLASLLSAALRCLPAAPCPDPFACLAYLPARVLMRCGPDHSLQVLLGTRTLQYEAIEGRADLEPSAQGFVPWRAVWGAIQSYDLRLVDQVGGARGAAAGFAKHAYTPVHTLLSFCLGPNSITGSAATGVGSRESSGLPTATRLY